MGMTIFYWVKMHWS